MKKTKYSTERDPIETEITPFSRLNSFGTPLIMYNCNCDTLKATENGLQEGDQLNCYFIDPNKIESEKPYLLEFTDEGQTFNIIRFTKWIDDEMHFICTNPESDPADNFKLRPDQYSKVFTGVAEIYSYWRTV